MKEGYLDGDNLRGWFLEAALQRARNANRQRALRSMSKKKQEVALVMSYCREDLSWMNYTFSRPVLGMVDLVLVRKCPGVDTSHVVPHQRLWRSVEFVDVEDLPLRADECSAYLGYLVMAYHRLPQHMIFVHADAQEHVGDDRPNILDDTLKAAARGSKIPFAHLGLNRVTMPWSPSIMRVLWPGLFHSSIVPGPKQVKTYCCSHFIVSRERVQLRPLSFYLEALRFIQSPRSYAFMPGPHRPSLQRSAGHQDISCRLVCQHMMFVWHVIFGEDLDLPHRMYDPSLPLFLKVRNIRTAYLEEGMD